MFGEPFQGVLEDGQIWGVVLSKFRRALEGCFSAIMPGDGGLNAVIDYCTWISVLLARDDRDGQPFAPCMQLILCCCGAGLPDPGN